MEDERRAQQQIEQLQLELDRRKPQVGGTSEASLMESKMQQMQDRATRDAQKVRSRIVLQCQTVTTHVYVRHVAVAMRCARGDDFQSEVSSQSFRHCHRCLRSHCHGHSRRFQRTGWCFVVITHNARLLQLAELEAALQRAEQQNQMLTDLNITLEDEARDHSCHSNRASRLSCACTGGVVHL